MKYCIICRQGFLEPDFFCPTHGLRLRSAEENQVKQCTGCASVIERGERFCRRCGMDVTDIDWSTDSAGEPPSNFQKAAPERQYGRQVAREATYPLDEDDSLRLRPFRTAGPRPQRRRRSRRRGRTGILVGAAIVSVSLVAWHAVDVDRWNLVGQLNLSSFGSAAPEKPRESDTPAPLHKETDVRGTEGQARTSEPEPALGLSEDIRSNDPAEAALAHGGLMPAAPDVEVDEQPVGDTGKLPEPVARAEAIQQPTNSKTPADMKRREAAAAKKTSPRVSGTARARAPSPEEIQRQREAERRRVQKEIEEAIANRGVTGVAVAFINGTVFLAGEVQTTSQRAAAEQAARRMPEVKDVRSRISVRWATDTQG